MDSDDETKKGEEEKERLEKPKSFFRGKIDEDLLREVQKKSKGDLKEKKKAIKVLIENPFNLPVESMDLLKKLAKDEAKEIRLEVANSLSKYGGNNLPRVSYRELLDLLANDSDSQIKKIGERESARYLERWSDAFNVIENWNNLYLGNINKIFSRAYFDNINFRESLKQTDELRHTLETFSNFLASRPSVQVPAKSYFPILNQMKKFNQRIISSLSSNYYPSIDLKNVEEPVKLKETKGAKLLSELEKIEPGNAQWRDYQNKCKEILEYVLVPPLIPPINEVPTEGGYHRRDLIFHIPFAVSDFWRWIQETHSSIAVIIECKNTSENLDGNNLVVTAKYLGKDRLGIFGVIISRNGLGTGAIKEQERLWKEEGKMIICLNDEDLAKMIELKDNGEDPSKVIDKKIRGFREKL